MTSLLDSFLTPPLPSPIPRSQGSHSPLSLARGNDVTPFVKPTSPPPSPVPRSQGSHSPLSLIQFPWFPSTVRP
ncbi:hypothetical protein JTE90_001298 [Oedothorax gibbosus]|uniref:Uncharacterized protein n=1 Tax=Oedothorax gibbosus TaxID=931172 RepID=A0AAV6V1R7_9ARAC|nr:hypothetical protein JTE90_001298 [Oedothorax gibbosus]